MADYIQQSLTSDERIVCKARISWLSQFWYFFYCIGLIFILNNFWGFLISAILFIIAILNIITTELAVTNKRVIAKFGLIQRHSIELKINNIESLIVTHGIVGRILNFGSIIFVGTGGSNAPIPYITNPMEFKKQVNQFLDDYDTNKSI